MLTIILSLQTDSRARAARNFDFFRGLLFFCVNMNTRVGNEHGQSDLFPLTHWSVVLAAGRSQAEPEIAGAALAELCQTYWGPHAMAERGPISKAMEKRCSLGSQARKSREVQRVCERGGNASLSPTAP
jgi:hypothetical protein